jgi:multiple sugar transport system ATP-binding protein
MNLIEATVDRVSSEQARLKTGSQEIALPLPDADLRLAPGAQVTIGIRPRAFELASEPEARTLTATVDIVEPMGAETLLHLVADGRDLRAVVDRRVKPAIGAPVPVRLRPSQVHIFDAAGARVPTEQARRAGAA